ncbi:MAG: hypothetical protein N2589_04620 [bacterium]|nr:hypothetical protein [bacterium]MCX7917391.1 hypothetical protein [bacterium]MDW8164195.1 hypothetical protein [Candidatus Omnitrophota bacterium]
MIRCDLCKKEKKEEEIYAYYPEDGSYICKECFEKNKKGSSE